MIDDDGDSIYGSEEKNDDEGEEKGEEKGEEDNERDDTRSVRSDTLSIQSAAEKAKKKEKHASRPPPGKREDKITQKVRVCVSSMSARVCNPSSAIINLDWVRFGTLLDKSAVDPSKDMCGTTWQVAATRQMTARLLLYSNVLRLIYGYSAQTSPGTDRTAAKQLQTKSKT